MLAVLNHRASAYHELQDARTRLMDLRSARSGLFITKSSNPFSCHAILSLLADIATAKFEALRIMLSLDAFETQLRDAAHHRKARRISLGSAKQPEAQPEPKARKKMDGVMAYIVTTLWLRSLQRPRI